MLKPYAEIKWRVENTGRPSIRQLMKQLAEQIQPNVPTLDRSSPVLLIVEYGAKGTGWTDVGNRKYSHHLNAPSAGAIGELLGDLVVALGICTAGQIVGCQVDKLATAKANHLALTVQVVVRATEIDKPTRKHKLLKWYVGTCEQSGKQPTRAGFYALLRSLDGNAPSNAAEIDAALLKKAQT